MKRKALTMNGTVSGFTYLEEKKMFVFSLVSVVSTSTFLMLRLTSEAVLGRVDVKPPLPPLYALTSKLGKRDKSTLLSVKKLILQNFRSKCEGEE